MGPSSKQLVVEGEVKLEVPELEQFRTSPHEYVPSLTAVFFNPLMELSRDISVSAIQAVASEMGAPRVCDPLAGVGVRALRYAKEVRGVGKVVANDKSPKAVEFIRRNVELNELGNVEVHQKDANALLAGYGQRFHVIDLDPFGSPAPFVYAACSALTWNGMLALTATDAAPLCGAHPKACLRRYGARSLRTEYCHELGLRILIGFCQRVAAREDMALRPLLGYSAQHYLRVYMRAASGAKRADEILAEQGYVSNCRACGNRVITRGLVPKLPEECKCGSRFEHAGPLWLGGLVDEEFVRRVLADLAGRGFRLGHRASRLLNRCLEEGDGPPTFYDLHELAKWAGASPPKLQKVIDELRGQGHFVSRTHFSDTGLRTDAPHDLLLEVASRR